MAWYLVKSTGTTLPFYLYHKEKTKALLEASREVVLKVNPGRTEYIVMSHHQSVGQNYGSLIAKTAVKNQN
jgi:hypothetical protein